MPKKSPKKRAHRSNSYPVAPDIPVETVIHSPEPVNDDAFQRQCSRLGYIASAAALAAVLSFMWIGHQSRPQVFCSDLIEQIFSDDPEKSGKTYIVYDGQEYGKIEGNSGIYFKVKPGKPAGIIVPVEWLHIPKDAASVGLTLENGYRGAPEMRWGFLARENMAESARYGEGHIDHIFTPNDEEMYVFTNVPHFHEPHDFPTPWNEADYFFFTYHASRETEIYLINLIVLGKR